MKSRLTIQERLKDLRKEKDINLEKLEELTGISNSHWAAMKQMITRKSATATL